MDRAGSYSSRGWRDARFAAWHDEWATRPHGQTRVPARARLWIPVVVSLLVQVPSALFFILRTHKGGNGPEGGFGGGPSLGLAVLALAIVGPLLLLAARRFPGPVVAAVTVLACVDLILSDASFGLPYFALAFAIGGAIVRGARLWAWISVGVGWVLTLTVGILLGFEWNPGRIAATTLGILIVFGAGEAVRTRRENVERFRGILAQRRQTEVQAERVRIARELHDVLAHSLSQINVQAGVGLHLMQSQPQKAAEALASIKETSKTALDEVRSVLGILRAEGGQDPTAPLVPEPDLARLAGLAASVTAQGVQVTLTNEVDAAPQAVQLAMFRIVQESLTNVVRHAHASHAAVHLYTDAHSYVVTVGDDGVGPSGEVGTGRGLLGMRERVELLGGSLELGAGPLGGVLITAHIPRTETG